MVQINEVTPSRFREGDLITINGFGFSPDFGANDVAIDGIPEPVQSESATAIQVLVPAGVTKDAYVPIAVFRNDTLDNDVTQAFVKPDLDSIRDGSESVPGQIPGTTEAADPSRVEDVPQAQDYERMVTAIEHLLLDVLSTLGDLFAFDGTNLVAQAIGAAGQTLQANPATSTGMTYASTPRASSLNWAGEKAAGDTALNELSVNGTVTETSITNGNAFSPLTGNLYLVIVYFAEGTAGDTLDRVTVDVNAGNVYDSGAGLAIAPGSFHVATFTGAVTSGDVVELKVAKLGTNGLGRFVGHVGVH